MYNSIWPRRLKSGGVLESSSSVIVVAVATIVEILRVANGVVLESEGLRRRTVEALTLAQYPPNESA